MAGLRIALAQLNPRVGDLDGNVAKIVAAYDQAEAAGCDIVAFTELAITGYPPEDLVLKAGFVADNLEALAKVAAHTGRCAAVVGFVDADRDIYNAAAICANGEVLGTYRKRLLPNYAVFDEARYFTPGAASDPYELYVIGGVKVGISICEDVWSPTGPLADQAAGGAELNININGSPYHFDKAADRERMLATRAADASCALVYVNQVCGQDELVFDGGSMVFDADGNLVARAAQFVEELLITDVHIDPVYRKRLLDPRGRRTEVEMPLVHVSEAPLGRDITPPAARIAPKLAPDAELYEALVLGTGDYVRKNGFTDVVIGLSGGIDSTLVACIAVDALGADHVHGVSMPSRYSSEGSKSDAADLAQALGIDFRTIAIEPAFSAYLDMTGAVVRRQARRSHRGEPAEPGSRRHADGAVEQVRLDGVDHRQQERDGRRLLHAVRRLGRWLRRDQGRVEDPGLRPVSLLQPCVPGARSSARASSPSHRRPSCAPTSATTRACRPTRCSIRSSSCTSRKTAPRRRSSSSATTRRWFAASPASST